MRADGAPAELRVVATLALDERDEGVLGAVASLLGRRPCEVTLLHVAHRDAPTTVTADVELVLGRFGVRGTVRVVAGEVDEVVAEVLREVDADLLIVGRKAPGAGEDAAAWGPHGKSLLRAAGCPVLVVPVGASAGFGRAAVGMDLSASALDALELARGLFDEVVAVAVLAPDGAEDASTAGSVAAQIEARFRALLRERGLPALALVTRAGDAPADVLQAMAPEVDTVVVGSRGLSPLAAVFLGSTAERLAGRNRGPVLVVRRRGEARGLLGALFS